MKPRSWLLVTCLACHGATLTTAVIDGRMSDRALEEGGAL